MQSSAKTVKEYLASLPPDRRTIVQTVRAKILENLGDGYQEAMQYGMIGYSVPHSIYPAGYHCDSRQPVPFAAIASQKNYVSLYLMCVYGAEEQQEWFRKAWLATGRKLDMGKGCVRFKKLEEVPLDVVGEAIRRLPLPDFLAYYTRALERMGKGPSAPKKPAAAKKTKDPAAKKPATKKAATKKTATKKSTAKKTVAKKAAAGSGTGKRTARRRSS